MERWIAGSITGSLDQYIAGSLGRRNDGSVDQWVGGSVDRFNAGSLDRWISRSKDRLVGRWMG